MSKEKKPKKISLDIDESLLERIDSIAQRGDITRSKLINNILEISIDGLEKCGRIGLLQTVLLIRDMSDSIIDWAKGTKSKDISNYEKHRDEPK